jgi:prepilin-type N-terminal cleavage/methylation domain-containing protein
MSKLRRGFSLIECVVVIVALAIAVPPTLAWMDSSVASRADSINATRATMFCSAIMENVLADAASPTAGLGFIALADPDKYVETPGTGLRDRIGSVSKPYEALDFKWSLDVGELVNASGVSTGDATADIFRVVTVNVSFPSASGGRLTLKVSSMVTAL